MKNVPCRYCYKDLPETAVVCRFCHRQRYQPPIPWVLDTFLMILFAISYLAASRCIF